MQTYDCEYLKRKRTGNNANDYEWTIIVNWLSTGKLNGKEEMQICYDNMLKNKKWYYNINFEYTKYNDNFMSMVTVGVCSFAAVSGGFRFITDDILGLYLDLLYFPNFIIYIFTAVGLTVGNCRFIKKISFDKNIDNLQKSLELSLGIRHLKNNTFSKLKEKLLAKFASKRKSKKVKYLLLDKDIDDLEQELKHYLEMDIIQENISNKFEKCLQREKSVDCTPNIANKQNDKQVSKFVQLIGENIKLIFANPYPNCENDINALNELANEYVGYIIASSSTNELIIENNNFYNRLIDLEFKIHENIRNNMTKELNEEYLKKVMNKAPESVDTSKIYIDSVVCEHLPTVQEEFNMESQNYSADDTEDKGYGRILSHNDSSSK